MKKIVCFTLAALFLMSLLCACGETDVQTSDTTASAASTTAAAGDETQASNLDPEGYEKDSLPESMDFKGEQVTLLYWSDREHEEFVAETQTGEIINDAIFARNANVEKRLNITFAYESTKGNASNISNFTSKVNDAYNSGTHDYDLIGTYSMTAGNLASKGLLYDLRTVEAFDWTKPWWPKSLINDATINGKLFFCSGDISANTIYMMYVTFFNKQMIEDRNLENPYDLVDKGTWTIDKMFEMCEGIYDDVNASQTADLGDLYGQYTYTLHLDVFFAGSGIKVIDASGDTLKISETFTSEKAEDIVSKVTNFFFKNDRAYLITKNETVHQYFGNNQSLFWNDRCRQAIKFKETEVSFGVIPNPKYNTDQEDYYATIGNPFSMYAITCDALKPDMLGTVLEAYASASYRTLSPALYDITLKYRYTEDEVSSRMYDLIRASVTFDLGRIFSSNLSSPYATFESAVSGKLSWSSTVKNNQKTWKKNLETVLKAFE